MATSHFPARWVSVVAILAMLALVLLFWQKPATMAQTPGPQDLPVDATCAQAEENADGSWRVQSNVDCQALADGHAASAPEASPIPRLC